MRYPLFCCLAFIILAMPISHPPVQAYQCGPALACAPPLVPVCGPPIVPMAPCCQGSPLFPPAPPIVAPVIVCPEPLLWESNSAPPPLPPPPQVAPAPPLAPFPAAGGRPFRVKQATRLPNGVMVSPSRLYGGLGR
jgi:hypothetical protein